MIKFVYKIFPAIVIYNDKLVPKEFGGYTRLFAIFLRNKYKTDEGLLQHELTHVKQFYRIPFLHSYLYKFSKKYRLKCEIEAYKVQLSYYLDKEKNIKWMSNAIAAKYKLNVSQNEIENMLRN